MMGMGPLGIGPIVKGLFMLAVSFFVLLGVTKTDSRGLQQFGRIIAASLFIIAIFSMVATTLLGFKCSGPGKMQYKDMYKKMMMNR